MDSHPKKRKKKNQYRANQKSIHGHVVGRENQIQSIQSKSKPNPITQYCNTYFFIKKKKKTQYRENQTPDPEQTKPTVRRSSLRSRRSQAQLAPSLVFLVYSSSTRRLSTLHRRSSRGPRRRSSQNADRRSQIGARLLRCLPLGLKVFLSLSLSLSL